MAENKVVIVGGGNAGLSAAYQLHKANVPYVLLESTGRVGGRVALREYQDIIYNDGAAFTEPQWETTFEYLKEFGLLDRVVTPPKKVYGLHVGGEVKYFEDTGNLFKSILQVKGLPLNLVAQGARFLPAFINAMGKVGENHDFSKLGDISEQSTREWVTEHGGPEIADKLLGPMLGMMTLARSEDVCAAHPISLMKLMKGMDGVIGGLTIINEHIYEVIKDNVRLNTAVEEVVIENDEIKGVKLVGGEYIETDKVIMATDAVDAMNLMPNLPATIREPLATCTYSKTWHYVFYVPEACVPEGFMCMLIPESDNSILTAIYGLFLTELDHVPGTEAIHDFSGKANAIHIFTAGWHDDELFALTEEERHQRVAEEIQKYLPNFKDWEVVAANRMERAINLEPPGQYNAITNMKENHLSDVKGLYLGGEYMFLIACTEGAWMTGKQAALKLIDEL